MGAPDPGSGPHSEEAYARNGSLERADLDGSNRVTIVPRGTFTQPANSSPPTSRPACCTRCDREGMQVLSCNLDGSELARLSHWWTQAVGDEAAQAASNHCVGVTVDLDRRLLYWTQKGAPKAGEGRIFRASLDLRPGAGASTATTSSCCGRTCPARRSPPIRRCDAGVDRPGSRTGGQHTQPRDGAAERRHTQRSSLADTMRRSAFAPSPSPTSTSAISAAASATST